MNRIIWIILMLVLPGIAIGDRQKEINDKIDNLMKAVCEENNKYSSIINMLSHPIYSQDDRYVCFTASIGTYTNKLYLLDLSNTKSIKVLDNPDYIYYYFVYSKDKTKLLYLNYHFKEGDTNFKYYFKHLDLLTGKTYTLYIGSNESISLLKYSFDESKIYFANFEKDGKRIYCINTNGQNLIRMEERAYLNIDCIVSLPDNKTIVYSASGFYQDKDNGYGIYMADEENRKEIPVVKGYFSDAVNYSLVFSRNYTNSVYAVGWSGIFKIYIDKPDLFKPEERLEPYVKFKKHKGSYQDLSLSDDGKRILFSEYIKLNLLVTTNIMGEMDLDGNILRHIPVSKEDLMKAEVYKVE